MFTNKQDLIKIVKEALCENEYQDNTNYNDIAEAVARKLEAKQPPGAVDFEKLTALDFFAGHALAGYFANPSTSDASAQAMAEGSYYTANQMLKERLKYMAPEAPQDPEPEKEIEFDKQFGRMVIKTDGTAQLYNRESGGPELTCEWLRLMLDHLYSIGINPEDLIIDLHVDGDCLPVKAKHMGEGRFGCMILDSEVAVEKNVFDPEFVNDLIIPKGIEVMRINPNGMAQLFDDKNTLLLNICWMRLLFEYMERVKIQPENLKTIEILPSILGSEGAYIKAFKEGSTYEYNTTNF